MKRLLLGVGLMLAASVASAQFGYHKVSFEHATDCPNNAPDAKARQLCVDLDDGRIWRCEPTAGDCDTAAEWVLAAMVCDESGSNQVPSCTLGVCTCVTLDDQASSIPSGANPTVDADGEVAQDTTADQFLYGSDPHVLHPSNCSNAVIENLAAADDGFSLGMTNFARTITAVGVHCDGTCTTGADIDLQDRAGNAMTHGAPTVSTGTGNTTYTSVTAANSLVAGEGLEFNVANAVDPETDTYTISFCWTVDRQ